MVSGLRRREKSESSARLASLEEHVVKMHAASWSLQKAKLLQLQTAETSLDQLRARHAAQPLSRHGSPWTAPAPYRKPARAPIRALTRNGASLQVAAQDDDAHAFTTASALLARLERPHANGEDRPSCGAAGGGARAQGKHL